jgi:exopolyphosphatase/guanosine-5'-triphosphate,3'-diphosphate pyrophosphatase
MHGVKEGGGCAGHGDMSSCGVCANDRRQKHNADLTTRRSAPLDTKTGKPVAAIDAGSNTIHLTVAMPHASGFDLRPLADNADLVRLGADVTEIGAIGPERAQRAITAIRRQLAIAREHKVETVLGIATEGVRRAANAEAFLRRVEEETGLRLITITGEQEAALAYWGATSEDANITGLRGVIDMGGGSLELIVGERERIAWRVSLPMGAGVTRKRWAPNDPPTFADLIATWEGVRDQLARLQPPGSVVDVTVCGGTATTLATVAGRAFHKHADPRTVKGAAPATSGRRRSLPLSTLDALIRLTLRANEEELTKRYRLREGRARLLFSGAVTLYAGLSLVGLDELWVSRRGIREGAIIAWKRAGEGWLEAAARGILPAG